MDRTESPLSRSRDAGRIPTARQGAFASGVTAIFFGVLGAMDWLFGADLLGRTIADYTAVNLATSAALILGGCSIAMGNRRPRSAVLAALLLVALAQAKLIDLACGCVPVDRLISGDALDRTMAMRNHMAPNTAIAMLFSGMAMALLHIHRRPAKIAAQLFGIWIMLTGVFVLVGYGFDLLYFRRMGTYLPMARLTALGLVAFGAGILALTRGVGLMLVWRDRGPVGTMFRITLPPLVLIPLAAGVLRIWGQEKGYYSEEAGIALQIISNVIITTTLLLTSALALYRSDQKRRAGERALRSSEQFSRLVAAANPDCISLLDEDFILLFANEALVSAHGLADPSELIGRPYGDRLDADARIERDAAMEAARGGGVGRFTLRYPDREGDEGRWFDTIITRLPPNQDSFRYLAISRDISEKREIEDRVRWKASHDDLTCLPNRAQFQAHLDHHVRSAGQDGFALLLLDIDNFKLVNDTLGHDAGDQLLRTVAERIARAVREGDVIARLAGDEFAIITRNVRTEPGVIAVAERIFESLREPWLYQGRLGECRISIGASLAPRHGDSAEELFKHADIALYDAKSRGKGQLAVFRQSMKSAVEKRTRQISLARHALNRDLVVPYYQPKVRLSAGRVEGFEALLRWRHPTQGMQMPGTIQAAFEDLELASQITERMVDQVLLDMRRWRERGLRFGHVAINVTAADLRQDDFAGRLLEKLHDHGLPHGCLQVEITETVFMGRGAEYVERALRQLHDAGIRVALDDFGTGYASLSHLKQFPVDAVKIDRSFLHDFSLDPQNQAIINTVISLGHSLDIDIVAEGIETAEQERHLLKRGCTYGQGYLYGKAVPAQRVPRLLAARAGEWRRAA